ncbi:transcriptional regulator, TetR family [Frankineae bacterium MT45]|nr:transcriptional regulator, TetR family [Frankineae bacterium MT45]
MISSVSSSVWAGTTLQERRDGRRSALLAAALQLFGTEGSQAVTVRSVCRATKLTDRYFYESFANREELVLAVYDQVLDEASDALTRAVQQPNDDPVEVARAAVDAFVAVLADDRRKGRILLLEPQADLTLRRRGLARMPTFEGLIRAQLDTAATTPHAAELGASALVGALSNLFIGWLEGTLTVTREELVDYCVALLLAGLRLAGEGGTS